jgi:peptidyl-prolyl cis-trans isomerase C
MCNNTKPNKFLTPVFSFWPLLCRRILNPLLVMMMMATTAAALESKSHTTSAAEVNGTVITVQDFQRELDRIRRQKGLTAETADEAVLANLKREALENIIIRELLYQESLKQKITIDVSSIDREMEQAKGKFATAALFAENLQRINMTEAMVREQVKRGLANRILIDRAVGKDVIVSEAELANYYKQHIADFAEQSQVRISHILLAVESGKHRYAMKEAGEKILLLRKRILAGEDFAVVASANSDCQSRTKGGDLGWFAPGQLTPEIEKEVNRLKVGELSGIVEDRFGVHIIKVVERKEAAIPPLDDIRPKVRNLARQEKSLTMLQRYVKSLRDAARVEITLVED